MKIFWLLLIGGAGVAQTGTPSFEVASVKVNRNAAQPRVPGSRSTAIGPECQGARFIVTASMLTRVIGWAYDIQGPNLSGWPALGTVWIAGCVVRHRGQSRKTAGRGSMQGDGPHVAL